MVRVNGQYIYRGGGGRLPMSCDESVVVAMRQRGPETWDVWIAGESGDYYDLKTILAGEEELFESESGHASGSAVLG